MMRGRNALQAILAGLSGGLEGQASQRAFEDERRRLEQDRLDRLGREAAASERQALMDQVALTEKGYVEQGARADTTKRAAPALGAAVANATSVLRGAAPTRDMNTPALRAAAGQFGTPVSSVDVGGKTFERTQTPEQERQMVAAQNDARERAQRMEAATEAARLRSEELNANVQTIKAGLGGKINDAQAMMIARGLANKEDFITPDMPPADKARFAIQWAQLGLDRDKFNFEKGRTGTGQEVLGSSDAQPTAAQTAIERVLQLTDDDADKLGSWGANAANVASMKSTSPTGMVMSGALNQGLSSDFDREYARLAGPIADAKARRSEVGVLTDQDISRYRSQVFPVAGENKNDRRAKLRTLQAWAREAAAAPQKASSTAQGTASSPATRNPYR